MALYLVSRDAEREPLQRRIIKTLISGFLAVGLSPRLSPYVRGSEEVAAVVIMGLGLIVLDMAVAMVGDKDLIRDILRRRLGGGDK